MIKKKNFFAEKATYGDVAVSTMSIWGVLGLLDKSTAGSVLFSISLLGIIAAMIVSERLQIIDEENERNETFND